MKHKETDMQTLSTPVGVELTHEQTRRIAEVIQVRDVRLWIESNSPWRTLEQTYSDEHFYSEPDEPKGRRLRPGPADETMLGLLIRTIEQWQHISRGAVVTSKHGSAMAQTYPALREAFPDFPITGGLKTWPYIAWPHPLYGADEGHDWLATHSVWRQFAVDARKVVAMTDVPHIFVMAEATMVPFYTGWNRDGKRLKYRPDYSKFHEAMAPLRELESQGIGITWYPFGTYRGRTIKDGMELVAAIRQAVPSSWFSCPSDGWPPRERERDANRRRTAQRKATGGRMSHLVFVAASGQYEYGDGRRKPCYTPSSLQPWLRDRSFADVTIYPGFFNSLWCGEGMYELLIAEGFRPQEEPDEEGDGELDPPNSSPTELEPKK